jgi:hypothetical protein
MSSMILRSSNSTPAGVLRTGAVHFPLGCQRGSLGGELLDNALFTRDGVVVVLHCGNCSFPLKFLGAPLFPFPGFYLAVAFFCGRTIYFSFICFVLFLFSLVVIGALSCGWLGSPRPYFIT